ncbi:MAG TPA: ABC transporter ATP-binding protein [Candidatus Hodarchaeales archaeon]|nr:ABC transporter ATP-binding protein [Candidatus Hodarchaeales archaeon]
MTKTYQLGKVEVQALRSANLVVKRGDFAVILGPSGSGKTTLLNLIGGIDSPTTGTLMIDGMDLTRIKENGLTQYRRDKIGFVFQFFNLIPTLTARENVELAAELVKKPRDALAVLEEVGLADKSDRFPSDLSGGEQQRVSIARALAKNPPVLLCDEPTGELDSETGKRVLSVLRRINRDEGKTVVLVTHNSAIAQMADTVVRLRSGEIYKLERNESPVAPEKVEW